MRRLLWAIASLLPVAILATCGRHARVDAPVAAPALAHAAARCPDLAGSYRVADRTQLVHGTDGPWERLEITGAPGGTLQFTWRRPPQSGVDLELGREPRRRWSRGDRDLSDADYAAQFGHPATALPTESAQTLERQNYTCANDLLRTRAGKYLGRDTDGNLVGEPEPRTIVDHQIDLWCGDGCKGIPLSSHVEHHWSTWEATTAPMAIVTIPASDGAFEVRDAETRLAMKTGGSDRCSSPDWWQRRIRGLVAAGASIERLAVGQNDASLTLTASSSDALAASFAAIDASKEFGDIQVLRFSGRDQHPQRIDATIERDPHAAAQSPDVVATAVRALLPRGTTLLRLQASGGGCEVEIQSPNPNAGHELANAMKKTAGFVGADFNARFGGQAVDVQWVRFDYTPAASERR